jgi:hypothetical protein
MSSMCSEAESNKFEGKVPASQTEGKSKSKAPPSKTEDGAPKFVSVFYDEKLQHLKLWTGASRRTSHVSLLCPLL